jgi:hypothetical protein
LLPGTRQPVGHEAEEDRTIKPHFIASRVELRCVHGDTVGTGGPRHYGGQHPGIALGVHHEPFLGVKECSARLQHEALDQLRIGFPDVQQVVVRVPIAINVAHQRPEEADKTVPGFNGGDIDPRGLDEVRSIGEQDRADIMRQAENAPAGRPGRKRRCSNLLVNALGLHPVGQIHKAYVRALEGLDDNLRVGFNEVRQWRPREKARQQATLQRAAG